SHWCDSSTPAGVQVATGALRVEPTWLEPVGAGRESAVGASPRRPVLAALVVVPFFRPVRVPTKRTASARPTSCGPTAYVELVAPLIGAPSRSHWRLFWTPSWSQVGALAVSVEPTFGVPDRRGAESATGASPTRPVTGALVAIP